MKSAEEWARIIVDAEIIGSRDSALELALDAVKQIRSEALEHAATIAERTTEDSDDPGAVYGTESAKAIRDEVKNL